jgi:PST family polysaccharide transporter
VYIATGRADLLFKLGAVYIVTACIAFVVGLRWGISGVAAGYAVANVLVVPPTLSFIMRRLLGGSNRELLRQASTPAVCAAVGAVCTTACNRFLGPFLPAPAQLGAGLALSAAAVLATACTFDLSFVRDCVSMLPEPRRRLGHHNECRD